MTKNKHRIRKWELKTSETELKKKKQNKKHVMENKGGWIYNKLWEKGKDKTKENLKGRKEIKKEQGRKIATNENMKRMRKKERRWGNQIMKAFIWDFSASFVKNSLADGSASLVEVILYNWCLNT